MKSESGAPVGAAIEFTKDGKGTITTKDPTAIKDRKAEDEHKTSAEFKRK